MVNLGRYLHEKEELAMDTTIDLEDIVDAGYIGDNSDLMDMRELEEDIVVWSIFSHDLDKCGDFVDLLSVESDDFLLLGIDFLSENHYLKYEHAQYKNKERDERYDDNLIHAGGMNLNNIPTVYTKWRKSKFSLSKFDLRPHLYILFWRISSNFVYETSRITLLNHQSPHRVRYHRTRFFPRA